MHDGWRSSPHSCNATAQSRSRWFAISGGARSARTRQPYRQDQALSVHGEREKPARNGKFAGGTYGVQRKYNELSLPLDQRAEWNGYRNEAVAAPLALSRNSMRLLLSPMFVAEVQCHHSNGDLLKKLWDRTRSFLAGKANRDPREKSDPWWEGMFTGRGKLDSDSEKRPDSSGPLTRPLTVDDVLRRGALARGGELIENEE